MTRIKEVIEKLESLAPLALQESYDNSGLIAGSGETEIKNVLVSLDCTEQVVDEALEKKCNLIISHHPVVFTGIKKFTGSDFVQRTLIKAIKNDIALYACHTNLDNVIGGVNSKIADKIGLINQKILKPVKGNLRKLVCFIPTEHVEKVRQALFDAGAGQIGNYDHCSYISSGTGTFRAGENSKPFVGELNKEHHENEIRFESIFRLSDQSKILAALFKHHPYEEVAFDIYSLENIDPQTGSGLTGELKEAMKLNDFLQKIREVFNVSVIRHSADTGKKIKKVSLCGGSGSFLINDAIDSGSDIFITGEIKYHQFFNAENKIVLADIGHFESEQYTVELLTQFLKENFNTFATYFSSVNTNPIKYF